MATVANIYIKKETLQIMLKTMENKDMNGIGIDISINDEIDQFGNNVKLHKSQSKDERDEKKLKFYIANGKVVWTDGKVTKPEPKEKEAKNDSFIPEQDSLPF